MSVERLRWTGLSVPVGHEIDVYRHVMQGDYIAHDHDFFEIALALEGHGMHETLYGKTRIGRGDAFTIAPGSWHAFVGCEQLLVVTCVVHTRLLARELLWLAEEPRLRFLLWPSAGLGGGIVHVRLTEAAIRTCDSMLERLAVAPACAPRPYELAHLLLLLHSIAGSLKDDQAADAARLAAAPAPVIEALRLIADDLSRAWTITALASSVALSPTHFTRLVKHTVGRPPMAHLASLRAEAAAARLLSGAEPVSQVGAAVGWSDPNYFARRFRAHFGVSPSTFRRRWQGTTVPDQLDGDEYAPARWSRGS